MNDDHRQYHVDDIEQGATSDFNGERDISIFVEATLILQTISFPMSADEVPFRVLFIMCYK